MQRINLGTSKCLPSCCSSTVFVDNSSTILRVVKIFMLDSSLASKSLVAKLKEQTKAIHRKTNKVTSIGSGKCFSTANAKKLTLGDHLSTIIPLG